MQPRQPKAIWAALLTLALLLGGLLGTIIPAQAQEVRVRKVWPLYYSKRPGRAPFGSSKLMIVRISPSDLGGPRVGFFESEFFGAGSQWRAAGWMAGLISALETGKPLSRWRISYDVPGRIDGPSAGGLMTATVLSGIQGVEMLPKVTMTGTINPDGTIGPVGGIYYKLAGAARVGMKKVLIPAGQRLEKQPDGNMVDLVTRGRKLGLEVIEVADIDQVYLHLTGKPLFPQSDSGQEFSLPKRAQEAAKHSFRRWEQLFLAATKRMKEAKPRVRADLRTGLANLWRNAWTWRNKAVHSRQEGNLAAAMQQMYLGAVMADTGAHMSHLFIGFSEGGLTGMMSVFRSLAIKREFLDNFRKKLSERPIRNVSDLITMAEAYSYYNVAWGVHLATEKFMVQWAKEGDAQKKFKILQSAALLEVMAKNFFYFADDLMYLGLGYPGRPVPEGRRLLVWAKAMFRAAESNLGYIEKAILEPAAKQLGRTTQALRQAVMNRDFNLVVANLAFRGLQNLLGQLKGKSDAHQAAAILGATVTSFTMSSLVVAKYYSLGARLNKSGEVVSLRKPQLLKIMLESAERRLRQTVIKAQSQGYTPVWPIVHLRAGKGISGPGSPVNDRVVALSEYWAGSTMARLMTVLGQ